MSIIINLEKAKTISHGIRRQKRTEEFQPLDEVIMKQIPGTDVQAVEEERQLIRDKYATMQTEIENSTTVDELAAIINQTV